MGKMYTCDQVAERYGVKRQTVHSWIRKKMLPAIDLGREYRITEGDLAAFEKARKTVQ